MKIVHILLSLKGGGIQNFLVSLAPEQVKMGHEVTVIITDEDNVEYSQKRKQFLETNGIKVIYFNRKVSSRMSYIQSLLKTRYVIKEINPDIVNTHSSLCHIFGSFATIFTHIKHCCTIHSAPEYWSRSTKVLVGTKPLIFCSDSALKLRGQSGSPLVAINNGIELSLVQTKDVVNLRKELGLTTKDKIITLVGSQRPEKNYPFLIKIVEKMHDEHIHFCVCGGNYAVARSGTNNKNYISTEQFEKYPNIHLLGLRNDIAAIHNGSDVYLSCSVREGLPISALEAFFAGTPCVLSPIVQHTAIAEGVSECFIPDAFEVDAFIRAIYKALEVKTSHTNIFEARKEILQKFTIERCAKEYIEFYNNIK